MSNRKVPGPRPRVSGKTVYGEIDFCLSRDLTTEVCYFRRSANMPNSGNSKRSPSHALMERTIHKNNMASEARIPNRRNHIAAATFDRRSATMVKTKKTPQIKTLCQA